MFVCNEKDADVICIGRTNDKRPTDGNRQNTMLFLIIIYIDLYLQLELSRFTLIAFTSFLSFSLRLVAVLSFYRDVSIWFGSIRYMSNIYNLCCWFGYLFVCHIWSLFLDATKTNQNDEYELKHCTKMSC